MKIAVTSQNFRTITGHAGKTRRFIVYQAKENDVPVEIERLDLAKEMSMHAWQGGAHPIDVVDVLITAGCGEGFIHKMAYRNIQVIRTSEADPVTAVTAIIKGQSLPDPEAHHH
ncbi:MAG: nitrogen fixation protein [gamma proteobacterium symbiont of Taylorina sp.]|nr:nitrogen fixation protein [gamma proteobacterium symbiont of Taylorina sp.]